MEMIQLALMIAGALFTWTVTVIGLVWWLAGEFAKTRHGIQSSMNMRFSIIDEKLEEYDRRLRAVEIAIASKH